MCCTLTVCLFWVWFNLCLVGLHFVYVLRFAENSVPLVTAVTLSPQPTYATTTLTCLIQSTSDADPTDSITTSFYRWYRNGALQTTQTAVSWTLSSSGVNRGEVVGCEAAVSDGVGVGPYAASVNVTIGKFVCVCLQTAQNKAKPLRAAAAHTQTHAHSEMQAVEGMERALRRRRICIEKHLFLTLHVLFVPCVCFVNVLYAICICFVLALRLLYVNCVL
jgi:hypothetical protein